MGVLVSPAVTTQSHTTPAAGQNHVKTLHDAMDGSMEQMKSMSMSGDPGHDVAMMMKRHHQGAIARAKAEIPGGTDGQLKQMARKMIDAQKKENSAFDSFLLSHKPSGNSEYGKKAMGMMAPMIAIKWRVALWMPCSPA